MSPFSQLPSIQKFLPQQIWKVLFLTDCISIAACEGRTRSLSCEPLLLSLLSEKSPAGQTKPACWSDHRCMPASSAGASLLWAMHASPHSPSNHMDSFTLTLNFNSNCNSSKLFTFISSLQHNFITLVLAQGPLSTLLIQRVSALSFLILQMSPIYSSFCHHPTHLLLTFMRQQQKSLLTIFSLSRSKLSPLLSSLNIPPARLILLQHFFDNFTSIHHHFHGVLIT